MFKGYDSACCGLPWSECSSPFSKFQGGKHYTIQWEPEYGGIWKPLLESTYGYLHIIRNRKKIKSHKWSLLKIKIQPSFFFTLKDKKCI